MISRPLSIAILACAGLAAASQVLALGFGRMPESIPFGQSLDLSVPLRLEAGESLAPGCAQAEVHVGDHRLPSAALQVLLEPRGDDWRVRLRSATVVQEPLVAVNLAVGCSGSVSRQFVVFADPPSTQAEAPPPMPAAAPAEALPRAAASAAPSPARKPVRKAQAQAEVPRARTQVRSTAPTLAARSPVPKNPTPRLKLEEPEERLKAATLAVAAQDAALAAAAQAASAAEAAASAAEQRMAGMEADLKSMRDDTVANRASMELMRQRLAQSEDQSRIQSMLAALVAALLLLVLWLGWRVRALQRERQAAWWQGATTADEAAAAPADAEPEIAAEAAAAAPAAVPTGPDTLPPIVQPVAPLPTVLVEESLTRPVSVDELIDLEQQAEFFLVLGEEDAAVDLLMSHLRSTGGTSPLPYLKLLEIYRRRSDHDAYERMRRRFSQRFNAVAPEREADPEQGRDLQDYPAVLAVLQAAWPQPLDAMTELENLLFRKRSGELFELPAYRDVLVLYSVARDLHRQLDQPTHDVDVLLPLGLGEAASPSIFDNLDSNFPEGAAEDRPTAPVDLDLSEPTTASSAVPVR
jgi:hypothetical protein